MPSLSINLYLQISFANTILGINILYHINETNPQPSEFVKVITIVFLANYYDKKGKLLEFGEQVCPPNFDKKLNMPKNLDLMIKLAEKLSKDTIFLRVDFYEIDGKVYFGELTFYPAAGFGKFIPEEWDEKMGEWINLSEKR